MGELLVEVGNKGTEEEVVGEFLANVTELVQRHFKRMQKSSTEELF